MSAQRRRKCWLTSNFSGVVWLTLLSDANQILCWESFGHATETCQPFTDLEVESLTEPGEVAATRGPYVSC